MSGRLVMDRGAKCAQDRSYGNIRTVKVFHGVRRKTDAYAPFVALHYERLAVKP